MKAKSLLEFLKEESKEKVEVKEEKIERRASLREIFIQRKQELEKIAKRNREIKDGEGLFLISVEYDKKKNKAVMKFYDPKTRSIFFFYDNTGHRPYCLTNLSEMEARKAIGDAWKPSWRIEEVEKYHPLKDENVKMRKIIVDSPAEIGGPGGRKHVRNLLGERNSFEAWIPYHLNYIYDTKLWPCMFYDIKGGKLILRKEIVDMTLYNKLVADLGKLAEKYAPAFLSKIPEIPVLSVDIEVAAEGIIAQPKDPKYPIVAIGFTLLFGDKEINEIYVLAYKGKGKDKSLESLKRVEEKDEKKIYQLKVNGHDVLLHLYFDEKIMLIDAFKKLWDAPIVVTFNGDLFDLRYMRARAKALGIPEDLIPIEVISKGEVKESHLKSGVHIDLYKFYGNGAIKNYAFAGKYDRVALDDLARALLGVGKLITRVERIEELDYKTLASYCWWDSYITAKLIAFNNWVPLKLIITLSRITRMPIRDLTRRGVSAWIENWFYVEHRERNWLIPNRASFEEKERRLARLFGPRAEPSISGKRYRGAIVFEPKPGIHWNVFVLDFASLYPSIIKNHNVSYETVNCPHPECRNNVVPEVGHWICTKRRGIASELVGFIRDVRVKYFKPLAKKGGELKEFYNVIQGALKVLINASYGVFGAEHFPLFYLPAAETITALGRQKILAIAKKAREMGLNVIYGDTDSIFVAEPDPSKIEALIKWARENLNADLEIDKIYKFCCFSARKKNYIGVFEDGTVDLKGLLARKRNVPDFAKKEFRNVLEILSRVETPEEFEEAKKKIAEKVVEVFTKLIKGEYDVHELAFKVELTKPLHAYKVESEHVKAAKRLKREVHPGEIITYVKTKSGPIPVELNPPKSIIDWEKYIEHAKTVFAQLLDAMGIDINELEAKARGITRLSRFFSE